jgi:hypothetical protein
VIDDSIGSSVSYASVSTTKTRLEIEWRGPIPSESVQYVVYAPHSNDLMALRSSGWVEVVHSERIGGFDDDDARLHEMHVRTCEIAEKSTQNGVAFHYEVPVLHARSPELPALRNYIDQDMAVHTAMLHVIACLSDESFHLAYDAWRSCATELGMHDAESADSNPRRSWRLPVISRLEGFLALTSEVPKMLMLLLLADIEAARVSLGVELGGVEVLFDAAQEHVASVFAPLLRGQRRQLAALLQWLEARQEHRSAAAVHELVQVSLEGPSRFAEPEQPRTKAKLRALEQRRRAAVRRAKTPLQNAFAAYDRLADGEVDGGLAMLVQAAWSAVHSEPAWDGGCRESSKHELVAAARAVPELLTAYHELLNAVGCRQRPNASEMSFATPVALELRAPEQLLSRVAAALAAGLRALAIVGGPHSQERSDHRHATLMLSSAAWTLSISDVLTALQYDGFISEEEHERLMSTDGLSTAAIPLSPFFGGKIDDEAETKNEAGDTLTSELATELRWALVWCDQADALVELERLWGGSQSDAVDDLIENTCWADSLQDYTGKRGTAADRRRALQLCFISDARGGLRAASPRQQSAAAQLGASQ